MGTPNTAREIASTATAIAKEIRAQEDVRAATLRALLGKLSKQQADRDGREVIQIALHLVELDEPVCRLMGYALIYDHPDAPQKLGVRMIERLGKGMDSWGDVDVFAGCVAGPAWREKRISDSRIHRWARSKDRWWRRAAPAR